mmetsp:Transcript_6266/g.25131  ORF Transcript_6266/g.25131 Transcript_6266/m.25131 type:complete len:214 (+) Transcript_6266:5977-6618(+)
MAVERRLSSSFAASSLAASRRASTSAASSSMGSASAGSSSAGASGMTTSYSFLGAGKDDSAASRPLRTVLAFARPSASDAVSHASVALMPSWSRTDGAAPGATPACSAIEVPARCGVMDAAKAAPRRSEVAPWRAPGIAEAARGLGVAPMLAAGVAPPKKLGCSSGFSPPANGVVSFARRAWFSASMSTASFSIAGVRAGVRPAARLAGVADP